jgi:hypothetical protein
MLPHQRLNHHRRRPFHPPPEQSATVSPRNPTPAPSASPAPAPLALRPPIRPKIETPRDTPRQRGTERPSLLRSSRSLPPGAHAKATPDKCLLAARTRVFDFVMAVVEVPELDSADVHLLEGSQQVAAREMAQKRSRAKLAPR